jgi:hypothetical protein
MQNCKPKPPAQVMDRMYSTTLEAPSVIHVGSSRENNS